MELKPVGLSETWSSSMKVGDLVKLIGSFYGEHVIGVIVECNVFAPGWHTMSCAERVVHWPETQIEVVNESR